mgnify:CR=1 FL=1
MTSRVTVSQPDNDNAPIVFGHAANDNAAGLPGTDAPRCFSPAAANDDWIEIDLPISIGVLAEEVAILDRFLRSQILALFD